MMASWRRRLRDERRLAQTLFGGLWNVLLAHELKLEKTDGLAFRGFGRDYELSEPCSASPRGAQPLANPGPKFPCGTDFAPSHVR